MSNPGVIASISWKKLSITFAVTLRVGAGRYLILLRT